MGGLRVPHVGADAVPPAKALLCVHFLLALPYHCPPNAHKEGNEWELLGVLKQGFIAGLQ